MAPKRSYDDLETDYLEEENESGFLSLVSVIIAFVAVAVFIALAWYAYQSSTGSGDSGEIEVVYPEEGPVREAPGESGGWQFPHQDKSVYDIVSGEQEEVNGEASVEQILPAPEQAVKRPETETKTWMNEKLKEEPIGQTDAERRLEETQDAESESSEAKIVKKAEPEKAAEAVSAAVPAQREEISRPVPVVSPQKHELPAVQKEAPAAPVKPQAVAESVPVKVEPVPVKSPPPVAAGNFKIQLGAVRSDAEARASWAKMQSKYSLLGDKSLNVQAADIPGKGTFHRIQASGFASRVDAKAACDRLAAAGQPCFVVGK